MGEKVWLQSYPSHIPAEINPTPFSSIPELIDDIIRSRKYVLPQREEQLLAMASPALESMDAAFSMLDSVDLKRGEIQDENGETVTWTTLPAGAALTYAKILPPVPLILLGATAGLALHFFRRKREPAP